MRKPQIAKHMAAMVAVQAPTAVQVLNIVPELTDKWSRTTLMSLERLENAIKADDGLQAKYWATAAGIGTDKIMPLKGMPTTIVSNVHQHRHDLSPLMDRLAIAARVVQAHVRKGYLASDNVHKLPVTASHRVEQIDAESATSAHDDAVLTSTHAPGQASGDV